MLRFAITPVQENSAPVDFYAGASTPNYSYSTNTDISSFSFGSKTETPSLFASFLTQTPEISEQPAETSASEMVVH